MDFGGVLTTDVFASFREFCEREGIDPDTVKRLFREDPDALALLRRLERGEIGEDEFSERFGAMMGVADTDGLIDRLFAGMRPDEAMHEAVRRARAGGVRTALVSTPGAPATTTARASISSSTRSYCEGAERVGMTAVRHRDAPRTVAELEGLLGVELQ